MAGGFRAATPGGSFEMSRTSAIPATLATATSGVGTIPATPASFRALSLNALICRRASSFAGLLSSVLPFLEFLHEIQDLLLLLGGQLAQRP
jgi:hypothetical protein